MREEKEEKKEKEKEMTPEEMKLREMLWLRHGCEFGTLYGDDGEMQCNKCHIDFKRMEVWVIESIFHDIGVHLLKQHIEKGEI